MVGRSGRSATWNPPPSPRLNLVPKSKIHGAMSHTPSWHRSELCTEMTCTSLCNLPACLLCHSSVSSIVISEYQLFWDVTLFRLSLGLLGCAVGLLDPVVWQFDPEDKVSTFGPTTQRHQPRAQNWRSHLHFFPYYYQPSVTRIQASHQTTQHR